MRIERPQLLACSLVALAGCANAGGNPGTDASAGGDAPTSPGDGSAVNDAPALDASLVDAAPTPITLSQTTVQTIGTNNSLACGNGDGTTAENSWYRIFRLADAGIAGGLRVNSVTFGVQEASGLPGIQIKIGTYAGTFNPPPTQLDTSLITPITSATFNVPSTLPASATTYTVPITANVPALSQMIVEVFSPNMSGTGKYFYIGGNSGGEQKPAYLRAPTGACATPQPRTTTALGFPSSHLVITVSGTY